MKTSTTTRSDTRSAAELEEAVLRGDVAVTPEMLGAARLREQHAALLHEAQVRRQAAEAKATHDADVQRLRDDALVLADDGDELRQAGVAAVAAIERLYGLARDRGAQLDQLAARARSLGVAQMQLDDQVVDDSGLGWRAGPSVAGPARVRVDDALLSAASPTKLVARAVVEAFSRLGQRVDGFTLANPGAGIDEQVAAQVREIVPAVTRQLRVAKRWGPHQVDEVVEVDSATARWGLDRGFFVPVEPRPDSR